MQPSGAVAGMSCRVAAPGGGGCLPTWREPKWPPGAGCETAHYGPACHASGLRSLRQPRRSISGARQLSAPFGNQCPTMPSASLQLELSPSDSDTASNNHAILIPDYGSRLAGPVSCG
jgi:hypothetical protein